MAPLALASSKKARTTLKITYSALCLALCFILPLLTAQMQAFGKMLTPMHLPVLLCGFLCGWPYGLLVGFAAPLLRSLLFGMPKLFPNAVGMAFELAAYGFLAGLLYRIFPKKTGYLYLSLLIAMLGGRAVWGAVRFLIAGFTETKFPFSVFLAGAVTDSIPGIVLQILLVPVVLMALKRAGLIPDIR